ncbi:DUF4397 domain-containing protein [Chloroflexus aggregans]|uniref:LPXTG-motif cell wall anchor domain protein n=2 Tax=Chloroflexus aggregans TaxID=152260 RepID=B8GCI4_CHLAD|nr:DUF4397 domain-containing protein [Chloroflexus aggregans]ACL25028.1 LPXTG-motif cell wall anchor domain protein [Chloroflexus aggregans DSM 9485]
MIRKLSIALTTALLFALLAVPAFAQSGTAKVRVIHASPDAPAVDVFVNGNAVLTNVGFFAASPYLDLPAGTYRVQVAPTGAGAGSAVIDANVTIEAGRAYTIAAVGPVASIKPQVIVDNLSAPVAGQAKVRVYHFSPDAPAVDVKLANGTTLISNLAFPDASDYLEVPAGTYDLQVTPAGGDAVVINLAGTRVEAGQIYSVFATNFVANITPQLAVTAPVTTAAPATLPRTGGETLPLAAAALMALALMAVGGLVMRRSMR